MKKSQIFRFLSGRHILLTVGILVVSICLFLVSCEKDEAQIFPQWYPETNANGDPVLGVFENKLPCTDCEKIKFALALYKDAQTNLPTTYVMARVYVSKNNDRLMNSGNVSVIHGTALDSEATVYQLDSNAPGEFRLFWKMDDNLLFILDENLTPRVGNAAYGYVLNRTR
jgi:NlpE N-terminal domain